MKLLSSVVVVFCFVVFQVGAVVRLDSWLPAPPIPVQVPLKPHVHPNNGMMRPIAYHQAYPHRFFRRENDIRQRRELGDKLANTIKNILQSINSFVDDLQKVAADSTRRLDLQGMIDKVKKDVKDFGQYVNSQLKTRSKMSVSYPCDINDNRPQCMIY